MGLLALHREPGGGGCLGIMVYGTQLLVGSFQGCRVYRASGGGYRVEGLELMVFTVLGAELYIV